MRCINVSEANTTLDIDCHYQIGEYRQQKRDQQIHCGIGFRCFLTTPPKCGSSLMFRRQRQTRSLLKNTVEYVGQRGQKQQDQQQQNHGMNNTGQRLLPLRILVAVRAMALVAANPPSYRSNNIGQPCPSVPLIESLVPAMPSATTADNSDSIAPSMAMAKAGPLTAPYD